MLADIINTIVRPQRSVASPQGPQKWSGPASCFLAGLIYSALCFSLAQQGLAPTSDKGLLLPRDQFFSVAQFYAPIAFILPAFWVTVTIWVLGRRVDNRVPFSEYWRRLSLAYGAPFLLCFALPDLIVFHLYGFEGLKAGLPAVGVGTIYFVTSRTTQAIQKALGLSIWRSLGFAVVSAVVQAPVLMALVR